MITEERIAGFIASLQTPKNELLTKIEEDALADHVPVIRPEMQEFLRMMLTLKAPQKVLEVGTAVGFSALLMAQCTAPDCLIVTIEQDEARIAKAKEHFFHADQAGRITLLEGDAGVILPQLGGCFDFIFMDAAKGQYPTFLPEILRLLAPGGVLVSDNVFQDGDVLESRYAVQRRNRTIHKRMREYLYELTHNPKLVTSILPVGDGAAVSVCLEVQP